MSIKKVLAGGSAVALAATLGTGVVPANAAGKTPLSEVLTADDSGFDNKKNDFDIVTAAVLAVLDDDPSSPVSALTKGGTRLTAFVPTDKAFLNLASVLGGKKVTSEEAAFNAVAGLGLDTVEGVLLYHVVPGKPIPAKAAVKADGAELTTAQGGKLTVKVRGHKGMITLMDGATDLKDAKVIKKLTDINKGNRQIAHGISAVMLPDNPA